MNIFEKASRIKLRFPLKGVTCVEDLWDLDLNWLDELYGKLTAGRNCEKTESLMKTKTTEDTATDLAIAIVKHIFETKSEENAKRLGSKKVAARKQKILEIIETKKDEELLKMSTEELEKLV